MKATADFMNEYWKRIRESAGESDPPTWRDNFRARFYTGFWYGVFARHKMESVYLPPSEEAILVRSLIVAIKTCGDLKVTRYEATSAKYNLYFWTGTGRQSFWMTKPHNIPFRVWSQRRLLRLIRRIGHTYNDTIGIAQSITLTIQGRP